MQGLAQTVWSYGKLGVPAPHLLKAAVKAATTPNSGWKMRDLVDMLWGCARLNHTEPPEAFAALSTQLCIMLKDAGEDTIPAGPCHQGCLYFWRIRAVQSACELVAASRLLAAASN